MKIVDLDTSLIITPSELRKETDNIRKIELINWVDHKLKPWFGGNIISIDIKIAEQWGYIAVITNTKDRFIS